MSTENRTQQIDKCTLTLCVLEIINRGECYTAEILEELKEAEMLKAEGALFPLLIRLKQAELVNTRIVEVQNSPSRKYYSLNDAGKRYLTQLQQAWQELVEATEKVLKKQDSNPVKE